MLQLAGMYLISMVLSFSFQAASNDTFCSERTTAAYHSPKCNWGWVVHDPHRVEHVRIPHDPPYHTYSRWVLNRQIYVLAYWDIDYDPDDMTVDIYLARDGRYTLVGSTRPSGVVTRVFSAKLTGQSQDLVFQYSAGELQYINVVRFRGSGAIQVFDYGATEIDVVSQPKPMIVAKGKISNTVSEFTWDPASNKFAKIREFPWRKNE